MERGNKQSDKDLETENEFLKMKLMLEKGAEFGSSAEVKDLPPEIENEFLKHIMEFEKQWESAPMIRIYDKVGRPTAFRPVDTIDDENIETAWEELSAYLEKHGISLDVCSPNIKGGLTRFFDVFGKNPLFVFALSAFLPKGLALIRLGDGVNPWNWLYKKVLIHVPGPPELGSLLYALCVITFMWAICYWMDKRKIYVKV